MLQSSFHVSEASAGGSCYDFTTLWSEKARPLLGPQCFVSFFFFFLSFSWSDQRHCFMISACKGLVSRPKLTSLSCSPYCLLLAAGQYTAQACAETIQGLNGSFLSGCRTVCVGTSLISGSDTETDRWAVCFIYLFFFFQVFFFSWALLPTFTLRLLRKWNYSHFPVMDYFKRFTAWYNVNILFTSYHTCSLALAHTVWLFQNLLLRYILFVLI